MIGYAALRWDLRDASANAAAEAIATALSDLGMAKVIDAPGWMVAADVGNSHLVRTLINPNHVIIGHVFDRRATDQSRHAPSMVDGVGGEFASLCQALLDSTWGSYIALGIDPAAPATMTLFREPIGMHEALTWVSATGLRIVTSRPDALIPAAPPHRFGIDWDRAAQLLQYAGSAGESVPLIGIDTVPPGALLTCEDRASRVRQLWSPAAFAADRGPWRRSPEEELPDLVDACIGAWAGTTSVAIAELSGGLDSAIVAAGLARVRQHPVRQWFHYYGPDAAGDERIYARAVAARLGISVSEHRAFDAALDATLVTGIPVGARPSVSSLSLLHHADMATRGEALGATCLFTGQGGDALFFQPATPMIAREVWTNRPPGMTRLGALSALSRWSGTSLWSTLGAAMFPRRTPVTPSRLPLMLVPAARLGPPPDFRWLADTDHLPPAKQLQIMLLAMCRAAFAPSWITQAMTPVHPLLSQPLVERVLTLSALELTRATRDRALIRDAYAHRLPAPLIARRSKGCVSATYGRMLAASLPFLRDYLLDGLLAANGIVDRTTVEDCLNVDVLMQRNIYAEIFAAVFMERWARGWTEKMLPHRPL